MPNLRGSFPAKRNPEKEWGSSEPPPVVVGWCRDRALCSATLGTMRRAEEKGLSCSAGRPRLGWLNGGAEQGLPGTVGLGMLDAQRADGWGTGAAPRREHRNDTRAGCLPPLTEVKQQCHGQCSGVAGGGQRLGQ